MPACFGQLEYDYASVSWSLILGRDKQIANPDQIGECPLFLFQEWHGDHKQNCFGSPVTFSLGFCRPLQFRLVRSL